MRPRDIIQKNFGYQNNTFCSKNQFEGLTPSFSEKNLAVLQKPSFIDILQPFLYIELKKILKRSLMKFLSLALSRTEKNFFLEEKVKKKIERETEKEKIYSALPDPLRGL